MQSKFTIFHPLVNLIYFACVIILSMFFMHPVFLVISLISGFIYSVILNGIKALKFNTLIILPMALISIMINILFNHNGTTVVGYLPWSSPVTYESIIAGFATAGVIATVIYWFSCYNLIMTNEKFIYLFGRYMPSISIMLSMIFRFVPRFKSQFNKTVNAQSCMGYDINSGKPLQRLKNLTKILSVMVSWALENSIETADSMNGRGYNLKGKTNFTNYKFKKTDVILLIITFFTTIYIIAGILTQKIFYEFYPVVNIKTDSADIFTAFTILCIMPIFIEIQEIIKWKYYQSKI